MCLAPLVMNATSLSITPSQVFDMYAAETRMADEAVAAIGEKFWNERRMHHHIHHFNEVRRRKGTGLMETTHLPKSMTSRFACCNLIT